jgi:hydrogenase maturation protease
MTPRILIAGIGNMFLGDDAFGCEVIQRLMGRGLPNYVRVEDFGIRGFDLAYALMDDYEAVILVDAVPRGERPGTLYTIEPDLSALDEAGPAEMMVETHGMNPMKVLAMVKAMGGEPKRILLVGCEPAPSASDEEEERMGLSEPVEGALDEAVGMVESLIAKITGDQRASVAGD